MDLEGISALLTEQGWALLESLPPYDEDQAMALGERLRAAGHPAALVEPPEQVDGRRASLR